MTSMLQEQLPPTATDVTDIVDTTDEAFDCVAYAADDAMVHVLVEDFDYDAYMDALVDRYEYVEVS